MSDNNPHHPGVRSLLAKFEGQSPIASPPSRGRSPAASDSSGTARQLSKVRASFVTVDGVIQSNPASPLRKTSGRSDSPGIFGPKINSVEAEAESGRQTMVSPTPASPLEHTQNATLAQIMADSRPKQDTKTKGELDQASKGEPAPHTERAPKTRDTPPKKAEAVSAGPKSANSDNLSQKSDPSGKKPSSVGSARNVASKHSAAAAPSTTKSIPSNTSAKPSAREVAKERSNSLAHKPSRVSLNPKPMARSTRGSTPAQETAKPPVASASTKSGMKSPTRPARVSNSMAAPTQPSAGKAGTAGAPSTRTTTTTTSTLHRKPSTLKSATGGQREPTPAMNIRRQASRPSLPVQPPNDTQPKQVNEGFLARMMRPTASSARKSQAQEEADMKPATKTAAATKAPRPSVGRVADRSASQVKPKSTTLRPHSEKSQALNKNPVPQKEGSKPPQKEQENEKENIAEPTPVSPKEAVPMKPAQAAVAKPVEAIAEHVEEPAASTNVEVPTAEAAAESNEKRVEVSEPFTEEAPAKDSADSVPSEETPEVLAKTDFPAEAHIESIPEEAEEEKAAKTAATDEPEHPSPAQPKETAEEPVMTLDSASDNEAEISEKQEIVVPELDVAQTLESKDVPVEVFEKKDETIHEPLAAHNKKNTTEDGIFEEKSIEAKSEEPIPAVRPATEAESSNVALDITNLALN